MSPTQQTVAVPITVTIPKDAYDKILAMIPGDSQPGQKIAAACDGLIADIAEGGLMLPGDHVERITAVLEGADPDGIVKAVEASAGMDEGQVVIRWRVDPSFVGPIQEKADVQGLTLDQVIQNMMDTATAAGWFYDFNPMPRSVFMTQEDDAVLTELLGKPEFTGADLVEWLQSNGVIATEESMADLLAPAEPELVTA